MCFYRGLHCPICANYLIELEKQVKAFAKRGTGVVAISSDTQERAQLMADKITEIPHMDFHSRDTSH